MLQLARDHCNTNVFISFSCNVDVYYLRDFVLMSFCLPNDYCYLFIYSYLSHRHFHCTFHYNHFIITENLHFPQKTISLKMAIIGIVCAHTQHNRHINNSNDNNSLAQIHARARLLHNNRFLPYLYVCFFY